MILHYRSLASSSRYGNAYLVRSPQRCVLIDCGMPCRRLEEALSACGVSPVSLDAIFVTHEHGDHIRALALKRPFSHRHQIPVYGPSDFWRLWANKGWCCRYSQVIEPGQTLELGDMEISCFGKPHDTVQPVGYQVQTRHERLAILTDLGHLPAAVVPWLRGNEHLVLESNYDPQLQESSGRPRSLIERVTGERGHLSNPQAAGALLDLVTSTTQTILLAHLSLDCNTPGRAATSARRALDQVSFSGRLAVAPPACPSPWLS